MNKTFIISAAIVLYKNDLTVLKKTIESFLAVSLPKILYLIDNSPTDVLKKEFTHVDIQYIFIGKNIGFGSAQNRVLKNIENKSLYHLVLNPDVSFSRTVIPNLIEVFKREPNVGVIAPKVLFPNGDHQYSCRKYPNILELLSRKINVLSRILNEKIYRANYQHKDLSKPFYVEYFTGCFLLFRTIDFVKITGFDERYFLYMEDVDICRKLDVINKRKLYYPHEKIYHILERGSSKKIKLFLHHSVSVFQYFYKWRVKNKKTKQRNG